MCGGCLGEAVVHYTNDNLTSYLAYALLLVYFIHITLTLPRSFLPLNPSEIANIANSII